MVDKERYSLVQAEAVEVKRPGMLGKLVGHQNLIVGVPIDTEVKLPLGYKFDERTLEPDELVTVWHAAKLNMNMTAAQVEPDQRAWRRHGVGVHEVGVRADDGQLVGYGSLFHRGPHGVLCDFSVLPPHRRRGVGRGIIDRSLERAEETGITSLYMPYLEPTNTLRTYYLQRGFHETEAGEVVRGPDPRNIMR